MTEFDIPNYLAIPLSVGLGFLLSIISKKLIPTKTEKHLEKNQEHLLHMCSIYLSDAIHYLNDSIMIDEQYYDQRNLHFKIHDEDKSKLSHNYTGFMNSKQKLEKFNENTLGDEFYFNLMEFFRYGQTFLMAGFCPKHLLRSARALYTIKPELDKYKPDYLKLEIISQGKVWDYDDVFY